MVSLAMLRARPSRLWIYVVALTLSGTLLACGSGGYRSTGLRASSVVLNPSTKGNSTIDALTGYPSGSAEDQQTRALLEQSGYEGGGTVVHVIDPITGYLIGSTNDQRIRTLLKQSGYEGGGTVVRHAAP